MISLDYTIIYQIVLFLVLWLILSKVLFGPYLALLEARERRTAGAQHESSSLAQEGERLKAQYEAKIAEAEGAGASIKERILQEARQQREAILARAREEAATTLDRARQQLQDQLAKERQIAAAEIAYVAEAMASKVLGRRVG
jgi:F-type H+-transporting ATPase subunit b